MNRILVAAATNTLVQAIKWDIRNTSRFEIVGTAVGKEESWKKQAELKTDIAICGDYFDVGNNNPIFESFEAKKFFDHDLKVLFAGTDWDAGEIKYIYEQGLDGYINTTHGRYLEALDEVAADRIYKSEETRELLGNYSPHRDVEEIRDLLQGKNGLLKTARYLQEGYSIDKISSRQQVSTSTVSTYKWRLKEALNIPKEKTLLEYLQSIDAPI